MGVAMLVVILSFVMYYIYKHLKMSKPKNQMCECDFKVHTDEIKSKSLTCFPKISKSSSIHEDTPKNSVKFKEKSHWRYIWCFNRSKSPKRKSEVEMKVNVKKQGKEVVSYSEEGMKQSSTDRVKSSDF